MPLFSTLLTQHLKQISRQLAYKLGNISSEILSGSKAVLVSEVLK